MEVPTLSGTYEEVETGVLAWSFALCMCVEF